MEQSINTSQLDVGAKAMHDLSNDVTKARDHLFEARPQCGAWEQGMQLEEKVKESVKLYEGLLGKVRNGLLELSEALEEIARGAEQTEETNTGMARENPFIEVYEETETPPPSSPAMPPVNAAPQTGS